jgi:hypothetical protein
VEKSKQQVVFNFVKGPSGAAISKILSLLQISEIRGFSLGTRDLASIVKVVDQPGVILVSSVAEDGLLLCEALRLSGVVNPIVDLSSRGGQAADPFLLRPWDGTLTMLVGFTTLPVADDEQNLSKKLLKFVESRLSHDLPKLIPRVPSGDGAAIAQHARLLVKSRTMCHSRLDYYIRSFSDEEQAGLALKTMLGGSADAK